MKRKVKKIAWKCCIASNSCNASIKSNNIVSSKATVYGNKAIKIEGKLKSKTFSNWLNAINRSSLQYFAIFLSGSKQTSRGWCIASGWNMCITLSHALIPRKQKPAAESPVMKSTKYLKESICLLSRSASAMQKKREKNKRGSVEWGKRENTGTCLEEDAPL